MSDVAVVGRFAGSTALGSVGSTSIFVTLFTGFLIGLSNGINVLVARFYGARHADDVKKTVHSALLVSIAAGVLLLLIGLLGSPALLHLLNTKEDLYPGAVLYLRVYFLGMPALALYNYGNASSAPLARRKAAVLPVHRRRAEHPAQPFLRHRLPSGRGGRGAGKCHLPVCLGLPRSAGADPRAGLLRPGLPQGRSRPCHHPAHPRAGPARRIPERRLCHCKPLHSGRCQLL